MVVFARDGIDRHVCPWTLMIRRRRSRLSGVAWIVLPSATYGRNLYIKGPGDNVLSVFLRDKATGALSYLERQRDGINGVKGLSDFFRSMTLSLGRPIPLCGTP